MANLINVGGATANRKAPGAGITKQPKKKIGKKVSTTSGRLDKLKTKSQKTKEAQKLNVQARGLKAVTSALKNSASETGKGKGIKAFA